MKGVIVMNFISSLIIIIIQIIIVFVVIAVANSKKNTPPSPSSIDIVTIMFNYYQRIRNEYIDDENKKTIIIGSPVIEYNGTLVLSGFLSLCVREDDTSKSGLAQSLGMDTKFIQGKYVHELVIRQSFSKSNKISIIEAVGKRIQEVYPNDQLNWDKSIPALFAIKDMKDVWESFQ